MPLWYQELPLHMQPVAWQLGWFSLSWYAVAYLVSLGISGWIGWKIMSSNGIRWSAEQWLDLFLAVTAGVLVGGRLGFVFLYQPAWFVAHPSQIFWPFDATTGLWTGIAGMSFHGGLLGVGTGLWWFARVYKVNWWYLADSGVLLAPIGSFFGRLANFVNGELSGRVTTSDWGMYFPRGGSALRYPSQLLEAFGEGIILFGLMQYCRKRFALGSGQLTAVYLMGYGVIRFMIEFTREPDPGVGLFFGNTLTLGQLLCLGMVALGGGLWRYRTSSGILERNHAEARRS